MSDIGCKRPYKVGPMDFKCGVCAHCRSYRRHVWTGRLLLELASCTEKRLGASFITLTYDEEHNPAGNLNPTDTSKFLKRLRAYTGDTWPIRYYLVGEYGERTKRPHYHLIVYGLDLMQAESIVQKCWKYGQIHVGEVNEATCSYIAGYVQKGWTNRKDQRLEGKHPEFSRMSLRPGLGHGLVEKVKTAFETAPGKACLSDVTFYPTATVRMEKKYHMGGYLLRKVCATLGYSKEARAQHLTDLIDQKMAGLLPTKTMDPNRRIKYRKAAL